MSTAGRRGEPLAELVLVGLVVDDELLGDLAEGRARREATGGAAAARGWYRRQVVRAVPHLLWHGATTRFRWVALGVAGAWAVKLAVVLSLGPTGTAGPGSSPGAQEVLLTTVGHGAAILLGGLLAGAVAAVLSRGARLVPVVIVAAFSLLWAWQGPFYAVYGPGRPDPGGGWVVDLSASSPDLVVPVLWQLPTMAMLLPAVTVLGGLAAVAGTRQRGARVVPDGG
ncbi:MAG: hypothetical protein WB441_07125 [Nocardioidaceae bacterium]